MAEIVSMAEVKRRYWFNIIKTCKQSGIPAVTWCKENHIAESTYWYWHKQFSNAAAQQATQALPEFVELKDEETDKHDTNNTVTIEKNGIHINIESSVSDEQLTRILRCLSNV